MEATPSLDFPTAQAKFNEYLSSAKRARATILAYSKDIEQLSSFAKSKGKEKVENLSGEEIKDFLAKLERERYTKKSISRKLNSIKTFYRFLQRHGFLKMNIAADIPHPKYEVKPPRILSRIEYRALRDACRGDVRTTAIVELFLQTGIRVSELVNVRMEDASENTLYVRPQESRPARSVPLNKAAKSALQQYVSQRPKTTENFIFVTKSGKPLLLRNIRTTLGRYFKIAGIEETKVNDLRHTFIAHHLSGGVPLTVVSKLVGHKRVSTTERYLELIKQEIKPSEIKLKEL